MNMIATNKEAAISNPEAEAQILGAILNNNEAFSHVAGYLEPEHFHVPEHAEIYRVSAGLISSGKQANPISLRPKLAIQEIAGQPVGKYLLAIATNPAAVFSVRGYAEQVVELFLRRELIQAAQEIQFTAGQLGGPEVKELIESADERISSIRSSNPIQDDSPEDINDIGESCVKRLADLMQGKIDASPSTGLKDLDESMGGWCQGKFYVVGGRPGQGKTVFGVNSLLRLAQSRKKDGSYYGGAYFSLEVPYGDIWSRLVASFCYRYSTQVAYRDIQRGRGLTNQQAETVISASNAIASLPIKIFDQPAMTLGQIEAKARETKLRWAKKGQTLDVIFVDYLGLIKASERYRGQRVNEVAEVSAGLLAISKRLNIAVVALQQLSRDVEKRESKIPVMSDLRDSGAIEQDANSIIFLYRPAYYAAMANEECAVGDEFKLVLNVAKARDGSPQLIDAHVDVSCNVIDGRAR